MNLLSNLNVDQLASIIERSNVIMWGIEGNWHVINTHHFAIRVTEADMEEDEIGWELADYLERTFNRRPDPGSTLTLNHGVVKEGKHYAKEVLDKYMRNIPTTNGVTTPYIYAHKHWRYRWVKFNDFNSLANDEYVSLLYSSADLKVIAGGPTVPLYFYDGDLMILPIVDKSFDNKIEGFSDLSEMLKEFDLPKACDSTESPSEAEAV